MYTLLLEISYSNFIIKFHIYTVIDRNKNIKEYTYKNRTRYKNSQQLVKL